LQNSKFDVLLSPQTKAISDGLKNKENVGFPAMHIAKIAQLVEHDLALVDRLRFQTLARNLQVNYGNKCLYIAKIAQLVEHDLAKVGVAGSSPVFRSRSDRGRSFGIKQEFAQVVKLVYTPL
jgi:hypothetical protein